MTSVSKPHPRALAAYLFSLLFLLSYKLSCCDGGTSSIVACPEIEKQSLLSFKHSLQDPFNMLSSWNATNVADCCEWKGVVCSNLTSHVLQLHLQGSYGTSTHGLSGKIINPSLLNLKYMKYLDLSLNNLDAMFPSFIGSLTSLEYLNLSFTGLYGNIPTSIGNLSNLHTLSLGNSYGSLDVDSLEWLSGLSKLENLNMNHVNLGNAMDWSDQVFNKLPSLVELHLSSCGLLKFEGRVANISQSSLTILDLSGNNILSPAILRQIFQLNNLVYLDLSLNSFQDPILNIANTTKLQHIDLSHNNFNSSIPEWLYSCKDLEFVNLGYNNLQGAISDSIANLTFLNTLDLGVNKLSGKIPKEVTRLCKLQRLNLSTNTLEGDISDSFGNMSGCFLDSMEFFSLRSNRLSGHIVDQFGEFKSLKVLSLVGNSLSGAIPHNLGKLSSLKYLGLSRNRLTGNLPESLGQLSELQYLVIGYNLLKGVVTESHFANFTRLKILYAGGSGTKLSLRVSSNWIPPFRLEGLRLGLWDLGAGSHIPSWLETQKMSLKELDLSNTGISGTVPTWFWEIPRLRLSYNQLHGNIPDITSGRSRILDMSSNYFSGSLPRVAKTVKMLDLSNNSFSGSLFHFFCEAKINETYGLEILDLLRNHLSGELPDCLMKWPSLVLLNLGYNNITGSIPNSVGHLSELQFLKLNGNKFSGHVPLSVLNCMKLVSIDLSDNNINGTLLTWLRTGLANLMILTLSSNKFSGEIPFDICRLSSLQILDLSDNMLSGEIPHCFNKLTAMSTKPILFDGIGELRNPFVEGIYSTTDTGDGNLLGSYYLQTRESVTTKGRKFSYRSILSLVTIINLSNNNLSGDIPKDITSLVELRSLNLSGNHLTGSIPSSIGNMKQLESLDFSRNSLSGEIPNSFTVMSTLNYLNLSYNNLTGRIPESTQLRGFDRWSFFGNNLCGPQLMISCSNGVTNPPAPKKSEKQDEKTGGLSEIDTFYVFLSSGYVVGLSAFLSAFLLKKSWRDTVYEFSENMWNDVYVYLYIKWRSLTQG